MPPRRGRTCYPRETGSRRAGSGKKGRSAVVALLFYAAFFGNTGGGILTLAMQEIPPKRGGERKRLSDQVFPLRAPPGFETGTRGAGSGGFLYRRDFTHLRAKLLMIFSQNINPPYDAAHKQETGQ
jgi:hypothetical protein